jgi:hypothetical protein
MSEHGEDPSVTEKQHSGSTRPSSPASIKKPHAPSSEYEPNDSRNVTGAADTPDGRWSGDDQEVQGSGEYEPRDSRNVTGAATTEDGRWTNDKQKLAPGDN